MDEDANRIVKHYERHALSWDADRRAAAWVDKPYIQRFLGLLPRGATVLDLGCGGGSPVALHMVTQGFRVTGVDSSPTLITLCQDRMPDQDWIVADIGAGATIYRHIGLGQLFSSPSRRPAGDVRRLRGACVSRRHSDVQRRLWARRSDRLLQGAPLYHANLDPSEYRALLADFGFELIEHSVDDVTKGGRIFWLARLTRRHPAPTK